MAALAPRLHREGRLDGVISLGGSADQWMAQVDRILTGEILPAFDALIDTVRKMVADSTGSSSAVDRDAMQAALRRAEMLKVDAPLVAVELSSAKTISPEGDGADPRARA